VGGWPSPILFQIDKFGKTRSVSRSIDVRQNNAPCIGDRVGQRLDTRGLESGREGLA